MYLAAGRDPILDFFGAGFPVLSIRHMSSLFSLPEGRDRS